MKIRIVNTSHRSALWLGEGKPLIPNITNGVELELEEELAKRLISKKRAVKVKEKINKEEK